MHSDMPTCFLLPVLVITVVRDLQFKPGDAVYALSDAYLPAYQASVFQGTYAQYALCKEEWVAAAPDSAVLPLVDAAAVPLVALTALQARVRIVKRATLPGASIALPL